MFFERKAQFSMSVYQIINYCQVDFNQKSFNVYYVYLN